VAVAHDNDGGCHRLLRIHRRREALAAAAARPGAQQLLLLHVAITCWMLVMLVLVKLLQQAAQPAPERAQAAQHGAPRVHRADAGGCAVAVDCLC
jgi:hypothetical protein